MVEDHDRKISRENAVSLVRLERQRQVDLYGHNSNMSLHEWVCILTEEVGELAEAINETASDSKHCKPHKGGPDEIVWEATHVAAVALAIIETVMVGTPGVQIRCSSIEDIVTRRYAYGRVGNAQAACSDSDQCEGPVDSDFGYKATSGIDGCGA